MRMAETNTRMTTGKRGGHFVTVAAVAGELGTVLAIARRMSLSVKNAKAIAARAGDEARGFQPITDFIDDMATETMSLVRRINEQALGVSRLAVAEQRAEDARRRFERAAARAGEADHLASLDPSRQRVTGHLHTTRREFQRRVRRLNELLDDIIQSVAAARVITTRSRIEASTTRAFRANLEAIADQLDEATAVVKETAEQSRKRLTTVLDDMGEK
jgi:methyl-accepting chemotaxis protein